MMQVGYHLIEIATDDIISSWGGVWGQCPGVPDTLHLPNGDIVCGPSENVDYNGYKLIAWMMDQPPTPIPQTAPMWAVRTVLQNNSLFDAAEAAITASSDNALKNVWEYGNYADRNSKAIASLAVTLNLTDAQIDQMFIDANNLAV